MTNSGGRVGVESEARRRPRRACRAHERRRSPRGRPSGAIGPTRLGDRGDDVGAVDRQARQGLLEVGDVFDSAEAVDLGLERAGRLFELRLVGQLVERAQLSRSALGRARSSGPGRPDRRRGPGRRSGTRSRPSRRPASRGAPRRPRGSSRPRSARHRRRGAAGGSRPGPPDRRDGRREGRRPRLHSTSRSASLWVSSNTSGSSCRTPASSSMSKKRRQRPLTGSRSKYFFRSSSSAQ